LLAYLGTLPDGQQACALITSLLERAERAERAALVYQAESVRALHRATIAEQWAAAPPQTPRRRARPVPAAAIYEYPGQEGICRVCGPPAPHPTARMACGCARSTVAGTKHAAAIMWRSSGVVSRGSRRSRHR
jgi:hypothetical protein